MSGSDDEALDERTAKTAAPTVSFPGWPALSDGNRLLTVRLGGVHRVLSWAVCGGGLGRASAVAWRFVSNAELGHGVDPAELLSRALAEAGLDGAVGMLTARDLTSFDCVTRQAEGCAARAVATVGMGNAVSVGDPPGPLALGTINVLVQVSVPLGDGALVELLALAAEARTAAVLEARLPSRRSARFATGTGTDCIVVAAPDGDEATSPAAQGRLESSHPSTSPAAQGRLESYAGKHTLVGALAGAAVRDAVTRGVRRWVAEQIARGVQAQATSPAAESSDGAPIAGYERR